MNERIETLLAVWIELVAHSLVLQQKRMEELETAIQTLETAVNNLEADETPLKESVEETVKHLSELETEVKNLETAGTLTPEKAQELTDKINSAAAAVTIATTALKGA